MEPDFAYPGVEHEQEQVFSQMDTKMIQFINEKLEDKKEIGFFTLVGGDTKENKVKCFQELLLLHCKDVVYLSQEEPFGDILITKS